MKRLPLYPTSLVLAALLVGCAEDTTTPLDAGDALMAKPGAVSSVELTVTITDACPIGTDALARCRIKGDGKRLAANGGTLYVHGEENVKAVLDQYGNLIFDTNNSRSSAVRSVVHDFSARYGTEGTADGAPEPDRTRNIHFATVKSQLTSGKVHIQEMAVGSTQCVGLGNGYAQKANPKLKGKASFHKATEDSQTSPSAYAVVRRGDADTWTMSPGNGSTCSNDPYPAQTDDVAGVRNDDLTVLYGYYHLPFVFTLTRK